MDQSRQSAAGAVGGYEDIHGNLRYWLGRLVERLSGTAIPPTIYDIGANDGELTLPWAAAGVPVIAFEPGTVARERLYARAAASGVAVAELGGGPRVPLVVVPQALGRSRERRVLTVYNDDTFSSLFARPTEEEQRYGLIAAAHQEVEIDTLDAVCSRYALPPPAIVKIDVEGAEREVLLGGGETFRAAMPAVIVEYSCINCANAGYDRREIRTILEGFGYRTIRGLYRNEDTTLHGGALLDDCRIWNLVALPARLEDLTGGVG